MKLASTLLLALLTMPPSVASANRAADSNTPGAEAAERRERSRALRSQDVPKQARASDERFLQLAEQLHDARPPRHANPLRRSSPQRIERRETDRDNPAAQLQEIRSDRRDLVEELHEVVSQRDELERRLEEIRSDRRDLAGELHEVVSQRDELAERLEQGQRQRDELVEQLRRFHQEWTEHEFRRVAERLEQLQRQRNEMAERLQHFERDQQRHEPRSLGLGDPMEHRLNKLEEAVRQLMRGRPRFQEGTARP